MQTTENTKKIIVIGDGYVGKTCLVAKLTEGKFINNYHMTIGGMRKIMIASSFKSVMMYVCICVTVIRFME